MTMSPGAASARSRRDPLDPTENSPLESRPARHCPAPWRYRRAPPGGDAAPRTPGCRGDRRLRSGPYAVDAVGGPGEAGAAPAGRRRRWRIGGRRAPGMEEAAAAAALPRRRQRERGEGRRWEWRGSGGRRCGRCGGAGRALAGPGERPPPPPAPLGCRPVPPEGSVSRGKRGIPGGRAPLRVACAPWGAVGFHLRLWKAAILARAGARREGDPAVRESGCCGGRRERCCWMSREEKLRCGCDTGILAPSFYYFPQGTVPDLSNAGGC